MTSRKFIGKEDAVWKCFTHSLGFGFAVLTLVVLVFVCGIFRYKFIGEINKDKKKLEVAPSKNNSKSNDDNE